MGAHSQALEEAIDEDKPGIRDCINALVAANSMEVGFLSKAMQHQSLISRRVAFMSDALSMNISHIVQHPVRAGYQLD